MNPEFTAKTRSGATAYFSRLHPEHEVAGSYHEDPYVLLGYIHSPDEPELWTALGCWHADGRKDRRDLFWK